MKIAHKRICSPVLREEPYHEKLNHFKGESDDDRTLVTTVFHENSHESRLKKQHSTKQHTISTFLTYHIWNDWKWCQYEQVITSYQVKKDKLQIN